MNETSGRSSRLISTRRRWIGVGLLLSGLLGLFVWAHAIRSQQRRWVEAARQAGLLVLGEPYRDEWRGPIDLNPVLAQLGVKYFFVPVRTDVDAESLLKMTERPGAPMVVLYTPRVSPSLVSQVEQKFPSTETMDWKKRFRPIYMGEPLARPRG